jgi:hypothetical protein
MQAGRTKPECGDLVESKSSSHGIILGKDMNWIMTTLIRLLRAFSITVWLVLAGLLPTPLHA